MCLSDLYIGVYNDPGAVVPGAENDIPAARDELWADGAGGILRF